MMFRGLIAVGLVAAVAYALGRAVGRKAALREQSMQAAGGGPARAKHATDKPKPKQPGR